MFVLYQFVAAIQDIRIQVATLIQTLVALHTTLLRLQVPQLVCIIFHIRVALFLLYHVVVVEC